MNICWYDDLQMVPWCLLSVFSLSRSGKMRNVWLASQNLGESIMGRAIQYQQSQCIQKIGQRVLQHCGKFCSLIVTLVYIWVFFTCSLTIWDGGCGWKERDRKKERERERVAVMQVQAISWDFVCTHQPSCLSSIWFVNCIETKVL